MSNALDSAHIWMPGESAETNARAVLPEMAREYFTRGRKVVAAKTPATELHPFRLATKRFRYTLELFRAVYGASLEDRLARLKPVQDALGDVNDCVATQAEFKAGKTFKDFLRRRADKKACEFYKAWKQEFDGPGQESEWVNYLAGNVETVPTASESGEVQPAVAGEHLTGHEAGTC